MNDQPFALLADSQGAYWASLCPWLSVSPPPLRAVELLLPALEAAKCKEDFVRDGFFPVKVAKPATEYASIVDALKRGVDALVESGWPPSFIFLFDEAWQVINAWTPRLAAANGGSNFLGDVYAWKVDPKKQARGWGPHRDRMGSGPDSFRAEDKTPMLSTTWMALSDAHPGNSCMYMVPASVDPAYHTGDAMGADTLADIFACNPLAYQKIRAFPLAPGDLVHFGHRVVHWGSDAASPTSQEEPRIAMSWVVGDERFERRAFKQAAVGNSVQPSFLERLGLVTGQLINYSGQTGIRRHEKNLYFRIFAMVQDSFTDDYVEKVRNLFYLRDAIPPSLAASTAALTTTKKKPLLGPVIPADKTAELDKAESVKLLFGSSDSEEEEDAP